MARSLVRPAELLGDSPTMPAHSEAKPARSHAVIEKLQRCEVLDQMTHRWDASD